MALKKGQPEELIKSILASPRSRESPTVTNELLREFHRGYPVERLRILLRSENPDVVSLGVWIASELGHKGSSLLDDISPLLNYEQKEVRFDAIDCILLWAGASNGREIASVERLIDDPEPAVRWKVLDFLARATPEQLRAGLSNLENEDPNTTDVCGIRWLLGTDSYNQTQIKTALESQDKLSRRFGVVAAVRIAKEDSGALLFAASLEDPDVKTFANSSLKLL